jgi:hypothetical protein
MLKGFHCSRLTREEVDWIAAEGMILPDPNMLRRRIDALMGSGLIPDRIANRLIKENQSHDINRTGRIWFIFTTSLLKDEFGVRDLFRFWGGEALYNLHDRDPEIAPILASIGEPTIVEACVPIVDMGPSAFPGEPLVQNYLLAHGIATRDFNFTLRAERPVPGSRIRRIISLRDDAFALLTDCATWRMPL